jgi:nucleotide-binding universal stress UspA family protein
MTFERILVNVNSMMGDQPELRQAMELAGRMQSRLTLVDVLPDVPPAARRFVSASIEQELVDHRWERLRQIAATAPSGTEVAVLRGTPGISLVREVLRGGYDLLIRAHGLEKSGTPAYGPIDMQLLRKCPCPVWLVGAGSPVPPRRILAAIDASCNDPGEADLNRAIIDTALSVRGAQDPVTLLYAWSAYGYDLLERRMSREEFQAFVAAASDAAAQDLHGFVSGLGARRADVRPVLLEGEPHEVLSQHAREHNVDLVVLGSVARTGLAGFVMGNTAERILRELRGSVLAIKPASFVSPVTLEATS